MKKMLSIFLATILLTSLSSVAYASSSDESTPEGIQIIDEYVTHDDDLQPPSSDENTIVVSDLYRGNTKPTSVTPWDQGVDITYSGSASAGYTVFSRGLFTSASKVSFKFTNTRSSGNITIKIWEQSALVNATVSKTIAAGDTLNFTVSGLDVSKKYYIASVGPTSFTGKAIKLEPQCATR